MATKRVWTLLLVCVLLAGSLLACDLPTLGATSTPGASSPSASSSPGTPQLDTWSQAGPGIEVRTERWTSEGHNEDTVTIVRCDLRHVQLSIGYQPSQPLTMNEWLKQ